MPVYSVGAPPPDGRSVRVTGTLHTGLGGAGLPCSSTWPWSAAAGGGVGVSVGVLVAVLVGVFDGVLVAVFVALLVGVWVWVGVRVGVEVAVPDAITSTNTADTGPQLWKPE